MKKILIVSLVFVFLVLTSVPASAAIKGQNCQLYDRGIGNYQEKTCASVNTHNFWTWHQGFAQFNKGANDHYSCIWIDYIKVWHNSHLDQTFDGGGLNGPCQYNVGFGGGTEEQTNWEQACDPTWYWRAEVRFKIKWLPGESSTWKVLSSDAFYDTDCG